MSYGGFEFAGLEYAGEDATEDGNLDEFALSPIIEEFCRNTCNSRPI